MTNDASDIFRRFPHHIRRGVGIGAEGEARAVMSQGAGQGLHIHPVLQRERGESMPEIVEPDVLRPNGFQDLVMSMPEGVRVEHGARLGRWEHVRVPRMFLVFFDQ